MPVSPELGQVLAANTAFYEAFNRRDVAAMASLWAEEDAVACVHPGWPALTSRAEVLDSWRRILGQPGAPRIAHRNALAQAHGRCVLVLCQELIGGATLAAANGFVYESGRWRMVLHQASQIARATPWQHTPPTGSLH